MQKWLYVILLTWYNLHNDKLSFKHVLTFARKSIPKKAIFTFTGEFSCAGILLISQQSRWSIKTSPFNWKAFCTFIANIWVLRTWYCRLADNSVSFKSLIKINVVVVFKDRNNKFLQLLVRLSPQNVLFYGLLALTLSSLHLHLKPPFVWLYLHEAWSSQLSITLHPIIMSIFIFSVAGLLLCVTWRYSNLKINWDISINTNTQLP